ncbi:hypothetical protein BRADI_5g17716v3 [Brachypodium distachyon]|uniref:Uncharacterized protein n=1 Tax=Brachypodium distachyon TaxID=15368 RepID=A0A0Q3E7S6_BRADI|nr:hypothetical protein BRADI_5g17716v3 [Brachypodium distachyon]KQJ83944.1 hypothetical protein BRADI_5g17716v3 [Brachypodium distachyon]PNT61610.1 hypothetical protein BRADI_5g17716v3 [Brachypodium distachyon]PNT61611.1 hypothetical protein BRADI_5g17716v3 [Brachypodium distachyon]PNT61612.1 hypothetical protein BRADI_5g17716v3 [Brachypodium distachyon]
MATSWRVRGSSGGVSGGLRGYISGDDLAVRPAASELAARIIQRSDDRTGRFRRRPGGAAPLRPRQRAIKRRQRRSQWQRGDVLRSAG